MQQLRLFGNLCLPYAEIVNKLGEIKQIRNKQGWQINIGDLEILISTTEPYCRNCLYAWDV